MWPIRGCITCHYGVGDILKEEEKQVHVKNMGTPLLPHFKHMRHAGGTPPDP